MVLCIIAFFVFSVLSIFSAKYRPLAKKGFECVFRTLTMRPCETGLDEEIKAGLVSGILKYSPTGAKFVNRHFTLLSWIFVLLSLASFAYMVYGAYNFYVYGNCEGPHATGACILNDLTGDYGRFSEPKDLIPPTGLKGITAGNPNASVKIIEFGCFSCPYTKEAESTMQQILREYNGSVYYVFKPFPLPNHNNSFEYARAVLCANRQGKEEELRAKIFAMQGQCGASTPELMVKQLANESGLNMSEFDRCYDGNETGAELEGYVEEGKAAHIYATPTFFINGKPLVGPRTLDEFRKEIEEAEK
ncbi:MAG TPA: thioredoxin domain-containing protein [Candidatus Bilamarchaeum sp.]|nr:thioredoxin domain-containing protein [Candidatus Bilamarchaeum sp.]